MLETFEEQMNGYLFGGEIVTRMASQIALSYNNTVTEKMNADAVAHSTFNDYYWQSGDAILYDPVIQGAYG